MDNFEERRSKLRREEEKELAKIHRLLACLTNAIKRDDRPKIKKWQRLLLNHYGIIKTKNNKYEERS